MAKDDDVFMTADEVGQLVSNYALSRRGFKSDKDIFNNLIGDLIKKISTYERIEKQAYDVFGVKNLVELQDKITEINETLATFKNQYLQLANQDGSFSGTTTRAINDGFFRYLQDNFPSLAGDEILDVEVQQVVDSIVSIIESGRKKLQKSSSNRSANRTVSSQRIKKIVLQNIRPYIQGSQAQKDFKMSEDYLRAIDVELREKKDQSGNNYIQHHSTWEMQFDPNDYTDAISPLSPLHYYPYFDLTPEQQEKAIKLSKEGKEVWLNFKKHISLVANNQYLDAPSIENIMDNLHPSYFIKNDLNGVIGVLGELQMLLIAHALSSAKSIKFTGPLRNKLTSNKAELGADILLNNTIGIQVKNYRGVNLKQDHLYQLRKSFTWETLEEKLKGSPELHSLEDYYTALCYNQPVSGASSDYQHLYSALSTKSGGMYVMTQSFFAANIDKFLTFREAYQLLYPNEEIEEDISGYANAFFIFGGEIIIPTSYIIRLLIDRLKKLRNQLQNNLDTESLYSFYLTYVYNGPTWADVGTGGQFFKKRDILYQISFNLTLNLKIGDLQLKSGGIPINDL